MTVCGNRDDDGPGFFTPCRNCECGRQVREETEAANDGKATT